MRYDPEAARAALKRHWGYDEFRGGQEDAVRAIVSGRDVLVILPTGGGKSLCFQVPALLVRGLTLVISPLISLMKDQVDGLVRRGVPAAFINSSLSRADIDARLDQAARGELKLLYVAPERLESRGFRERLPDLNIGILAVDEAHCVSQWGDEFRPSYLRIADLRGEVGCAMIALTATATPDVRRDVARKLKLRDPLVLVRGFDRPNLSWHVAHVPDAAAKDRVLPSLLRRVEDGVAIVYAPTRRVVDAVTDLLRRRGLAAVAYHAGVRGDERRRIQDLFMEARARVVVATNAFGMGIDKPDVRLVTHYAISSSLEDYYQEAGRAGRDGNHSDCLLLHAPGDLTTREFLLEQAIPDRAVLTAVYNALARMVDKEGVARATLRDVARAAGPDCRGEKQAEAALRLLGRFDTLRVDPGDGAASVRVLATRARLRRELADAPVESRIIEALERSDGTFELRWLTRAARVNGDVASILDGLRERGLIDWTPATAVLRITLAKPGALPAVDWAALSARRTSEAGRLRSMEAYARHRGCRRAFLLHYFGDVAPERCGTCDNCLLSAGVPVPFASQRGRRSALPFRGNPHRA